MAAEIDTLREAAGRLGAGEALPADLEARVNAIFADHRAQLVRIARGWGADAARGEEIAQETMEIGWRKLPAFRFESSFLHFLGQIARNLARRDRAKLADLLTTDGVIEGTSEEIGALGLLRDEEQQQVFEAAIGDLPVEEQDALHLRYELGLSQDEITERLGIEAASGARGVLQSARRHLKGRLREALIALGHGSSFFGSSIL
jgi:RNA polymerase sigma factor (sigma-70 family)